MQKKTDGKIYALKSLVKSEMVRPAQVAQTSSSNIFHSSRKINLLMFVLSVIFLPSPTVLGLSSFIRHSRTAHSCTCSWSSYLEEI